MAKQPSSVYPFLKLSIPTLLYIAESIPFIPAHNSSKDGGSKTYTPVGTIWAPLPATFVCARAHSCIKYDGYCVSNALIDYVKIYL